MYLSFSAFTVLPSFFYLVMFIPTSWKEPLEKVRLILQSNGETDWEALKGLALQFFEEKRFSEDRVESLARVERLAESFKEIYTTISPAEWHKTVQDIIYAANFRASKIAVQTRPIVTSEEQVSEEVDEE